MKFLIWNCCGLGKKTAQAYCRKLIATHHPSMNFLLETQLTEAGLCKVVKELGRGWRTYAVHAQGRSRWILMLIK